MNTGIQDATSLAKTLVKLRESGALDSLDEWSKKRHLVAAEVVKLTDRMTRLATVRSPSMQHLRNLGVLLAGQIPALRTAFARKLAELDAL